MLFIVFHFLDNCSFECAVCIFPTALVIFGGSLFEIIQKFSINGAEVPYIHWQYVNDLVKLQGCAARNVHGFTLDDIERMAGQWEEAPTLYLQLDIKVVINF